jgi:hypothetical protein
MLVQICHIKRPTYTQNGTFSAITPTVCVVREVLRLDVRLVSPYHACFFLHLTRGIYVRSQTALFLLSVFLSLLTRGNRLDVRVALSVMRVYVPPYEKGLG